MVFCYNRPRKLNRIWGKEFFRVNKTEPKRHCFTAVVWTLIFPINL